MNSMLEYRIKEVKTRKPHICEICHKIIPSGSIARNMNGMSVTEDGTFPFNYYCCEECMEVIEIDEGEESYAEHMNIY